MIGMRKSIVPAALAALLLLPAVVWAQPLHLEPGSALVYPLFDSTHGAGTVLCVTNTNTSNRYCDDTDYREGDIVIHYQYFDGDDCLEFDRYEFLTPGDTLCVLAAHHNPDHDRGFLFVAAVDPSTFQKVVFPYLIGSAIVVQSDLNFLWAYTPYAFRGYENAVPIDADCPLSLTEWDGDGAMDFDGIEYSTFPSDLYIPSFFEETGVFSNQLTLMSLSGQDYINEVNVWFWNNIEDRYSRTHKFTCWWSGPLSEISRVAGRLEGDEEELGHPPVQTGWAHIRGNRILDLSGNPVDIGGGVPALLGVFAQFITSTDFAVGHALAYRGTMDGAQCPPDFE